MIEIGKFIIGVLIGLLAYAIGTLVFPARDKPEDALIKNVRIIVSGNATVDIVPLSSKNIHFGNVRVDDKVLETDAKSFSYTNKGE